MPEISLALTNLSMTFQPDKQMYFFISIMLKFNEHKYKINVGI